MIWFFTITSILFVIIGLILFFAPEKMLFLMSEKDKQHVANSRTYRAIARIGALLVIFLCAPLNLVIGFLIVLALE